MKYVFQLGVLLAVTIVGEVLHALLPLPIPGSIYGLVLLFGGLCLKIIPLSWVEETGDYLLLVMPVMFLPALVGLMDKGELLMPLFLPLLVVVAVTTLLVMAATGSVAEFLLKGKE